MPVATQLAAYGILALAILNMQSHLGHGQLLDFTLVDFLRDVQRLHGFENILSLQNRNATAMPATYSTPTELVDAANGTLERDTFVQLLMDELAVPMLQLDELAAHFLGMQFRHHWLTIVYVDNTLDTHTQLLRQMALNLRQITKTKILVLLKLAEVDLEASVEETLLPLFQLCWRLKFINVVALFADYQSTAHFYSYTPFPHFALELRHITADVAQRADVFATRLQNLLGYQLPIIIGGSEPRIIVYYDQRGEMVVGGFAGHFMRAFAQKFNCSLYEPLPARPNAFAPSQQLIAAVRNGTVEISLGLTYPSIPIKGYTYPLEQMNWCISLPVEPNVPYYEFFVVVFDASAFALTMSAILVISMLLTAALLLHGYKADLFDFLIHDDCLRGVLGQSFSEVLHPPKIVRFIYLQICVLGILLTTTFNSYFSTYVTSPPKQPALLNYDQILRSGMKISAWAPEYNELLGRIDEFKKYVSMFFIEPNYLKYLQRRDSFDTRYGYMMPSTKWNIVQEQQKIFTSPLFRLPTDLCFFNNIPMCFPVHENSVYMESVQTLILEAAQSGLTDYWFKISFLELIRAGKLNFADLSSRNEYTAMKPGDLQYVWIGLGVMAAVTTVIFLCELLWYHRANFWHFLQRKIFCNCGGQLRMVR